MADPETGGRGFVQESALRSDIEQVFSYYLSSAGEVIYVPNCKYGPFLGVIAGEVTVDLDVFEDQEKRTIELWQDKQGTRIFACNQAIRTEGHTQVTDEVVRSTDEGRDADGEEIEMLRMLLINTDWSIFKTRQAMKNRVGRVVKLLSLSHE
ncbi:MAG TPA: hypothetical protein VGF75_06920 [Candidatus Saccharimonadales bacterium]